MKQYYNDNDNDNDKKNNLKSIPKITKISNLPNFVKSILKSDQPGRIIAVFIVAPILLYKSCKYNDMFILIFSIILFVWDMYWLIIEPPRINATF